MGLRACEASPAVDYPQHDGLYCLAGQVILRPDGSEREVYVETECPRGQMGFGVVGRPAKENVPLRVRARSSSFCNLSVSAELCRGGLLADIPAVIGSFDVVMGEIDR